MHCAAVIATIRPHGAEVPVCPSCGRVRPGRYTSGVDLKEVELIDRVVIADTAEED